MKTNKKGYLKLVLKLTVTVAALIFVLSRIDKDQLFALYSNASLPPVLAALALFIVSKTLAAVRLNRFLTSAGISLSEKDNLRLYLLGMFYNLFLPGGISGDGYKVLLLKKRFGIGARPVLKAVLTDRVSGVVALCVLSVPLFYYIDYAAGLRPFVWITIPLLYAAFHVAIHHFFSVDAKIAFITSLLSFGVQLLMLLSAWMIMKGLHITTYETAYLFVFMISSIIAILPLTVGGIGSREVTFLFGAGILHLDPNLSVGLSLLFYFITLIVSLSGILYVFSDPLKDKRNADKVQEIF